MLASWMGGPDVAAGRGHPQPRQHPDLPVSRHRRPGVQLHVAVQLQPARPLRDAGACPRRARTCRRAAQAAEQIIDAGRASGPHHPHRVRIQAACWPPTASRRSTRASPRPKTRPCGRPKRSATRSCSSSTPRPSRTRPTSAACSSTSTTPTPCGSAFTPIETSVAEKVGGRALPGRDRAADGQARRLRAHHRQQPRPAVRPGAAVRHRRPARRGVQGPRARPAAAQHHAGPAA